MTAFLAIMLCTVAVIAAIGYKLKSKYVHLHLLTWMFQPQCKLQLMKTEVAFQHAYEKETDRNEMERGKKVIGVCRWYVCDCTVHP